MFNSHAFDLIINLKPYCSLNCCSTSSLVDDSLPTLTSLLHKLTVPTLNQSINQSIVDLYSALMQSSTKLTCSTQTRSSTNSRACTLKPLATGAHAR